MEGWSYDFGITNSTKFYWLSKSYCKTYLHGLVDGAQNTVVVGLRLVAAGAGGEGGHGDGQGAAAAHPAIVVVA